MEADGGRWNYRRGRLSFDRRPDEGNHQSGWGKNLSIRGRKGSVAASVGTRGWRLPVTHPRLGENVGAVVVLHPNAETTSTELRTFLRTHLAAVKIPPRIDIVNSIPKGATGKIFRAQLAEDAVNRSHRFDPPEHPLEFQITEIWQRLLKRPNIGIHDDFFEAGGNSLLATQMLLEVEAIVGRRLSQSALAEASTIHQLATIAVMEAGDNDELVTKAKDGGGAPFFFCHGDFATRGFYALKLAALLDPDLPVYLIHPVRDPDETSELIFEDMARPYVLSTPRNTPQRQLSRRLL